MFPYAIKTATEHRNRWQAAVAKQWDFTACGPGNIPTDSDRPVIHPENVFYFHDGLRLIVSIDKYSHQSPAYLHVSASVRDHSGLYKKIRTTRFETAFKSFCDLVVALVQFLCGRTVTIGYVTSGKGVPHFFDPPLKKETERVAV